MLTFDEAPTGSQQMSLIICHFYTCWSSFSCFSPSALEVDLDRGAHARPIAQVPGEGGDVLLEGAEVVRGGVVGLALSRLFAHALSRTEDQATC